MTGLFDRGPESFPHLCPHKVFFMRSSLYDPRQGKRAPTEEGPRWFVGYAEPLRPIVAALPSLFPRLRMILRIVGIDPAILAPVTWLDFVLAKELDRKSVVKGKSVSGRVDIGGRRTIKKKT